MIHHKDGQRLDLSSGQVGQTISHYHVPNVLVRSILRIFDTDFNNGTFPNRVWEREQIEPWWEPLHNNKRFQKLVAG